MYECLTDIPDDVGKEPQERTKLLMSINQIYIQK